MSDEEKTWQATFFGTLASMITEFRSLLGALIAMEAHSGARRHESAKGLRPV
jgi:hypothetical protein